MAVSSLRQSVNASEHVEGEICDFNLTLSYEKFKLDEADDLSACRVLTSEEVIDAALHSTIGPGREGIRP
jgi:hypothetical protein